MLPLKQSLQKLQTTTLVPPQHIVSYAVSVKSNFLEHLYKNLKVWESKTETFILVVL